MDDDQSSDLNARLSTHAIVKRKTLTWALFPSRIFL